MSSLPASMTLRTFFFWFCSYAFLWLILSAGQGWLFGAVFCVLAALCTIKLGARWWPIKLRYLPAFLLFFLKEIWLGGWDVARRALQPSLPIHPGWVQLQLRSGQPQLNVLLSVLIGLMPGTLAASIQQQQLSVHVLDTRQDWQSAIRETEKRLIRIFSGDPP